MPEEDLCFRFGLSLRSQVSAILKIWLNFLASEFGPYIVWPNRQEVRKNLPKAFKNNKYKIVVGIIDCSEFQIQPNSIAIDEVLSVNNTIKFQLLRSLAVNNTIRVGQTMLNFTILCVLHFPKNQRLTLSFFAFSG